MGSSGTVTLLGSLEGLTPGEYNVRETGYAKDISGFAYVGTSVLPSGDDNYETDLILRGGSSGTVTFTNEYEKNTVSLTGVVESETDRKVYSTLSYLVESVNVQVGDVVQAGDVLAQLDTEQLEMDIAQQQAAVDASNSQSAHQIEVNRKAYENAVENYENGLDSNAISAESGVNQAESSLTQAEYGVDSAQLQVDAAEAAVRDARENYYITRDQLNGNVDDAREALDDAEDALAEAQAEKAEPAAPAAPAVRTLYVEDMGY